MFVANASDQEVFFDQMEVEHIPQLIVQENHYYPFGLELAGLNKKGKPEHRWKFQGQEEQKEFGLNWSSFKWRNADVALGRFFSVDPLAEDYVYNSTYAFSENRVVNAIELEGLEKVLVSKLGKDAPIYNGGMKMKGRGAIHVVTHGNPVYFLSGWGSAIRAQNYRTFTNILKTSDLWKSQYENKAINVVLHSCRTGRCIKKNGIVKDVSVAQKLSGKMHKMLGMDVTITAPDERVVFLGKGGRYAGPIKAKNTDENGEYTTSRDLTSEYGNWNVFLNGELIGTFKHKQGDKPEAVTKQAKGFVKLRKDAKNVIEKGPPPTRKDAYRVSEEEKLKTQNK